MTKTVHNSFNDGNGGDEPMVFAGFHLPPVDKAALRRISRERECSQGSVLREAVREYLERRGLREARMSAAGGAS